MSIDASVLASRARADLLRRSRIFEEFFRAESARLASACQEMSRRFLAGGRLLAFGEGAAASDAQHVAVEFIHPIIVGKRALPALDLGPDFAARLPVFIRPNDMAMGFAFASTEPCSAVNVALAEAKNCGAMTFALAGDAADYSFALPDADPFVCQEVFEVLYHLLWETVHVYFEHREQGHDVGASSFLYPFLGKQEQSVSNVVEEVRRSMLHKVDEVNRIRTATAETECEGMAAATLAIDARLRSGGKIIAFGNGGSATDANDLAADCLTPPAGLTPIPALSLAAEPANITAIANDIGTEAIFARQLIAHAQSGDIAVGFSTSGGSANILTAFAEARRRGLLTVAILGYDGGKIAQDRLVDHAIIARSDYIPRIQEAQASIYHILRRSIADLN
ncbi:MAG: sugar isomerase [Chthonomonadaceae bacterium]|nr:sugar isomerase [Chthonomonadaceae bacterium]